MSYYAYCAGKRKDGQPCGRKVPTLPSGVVIYRYCWQHRKRRTHIGTETGPCIGTADCRAAEHIDGCRAIPGGPHYVAFGGAA